MNTVKLNRLLTPITRLGLMLAGLLIAGLCQATPFHGSDAFGHPGDKKVEVSLIDDAIADLDSATIKATYDPLFVVFADVTAGELTSAGFFVILAGNPYADGALMAVDVSLAGPSTLPSGTGSILALIFDILPGAPLGVTPVTFVSLNDDYEDIDTTGHVHVTAQTIPVPEPGAMILMLAGLLLMRRQWFGEEK